MFAFPIGTDRPQRRFPWANVVLIAANILLYFMSHPMGRVPGQLGVSTYGMWEGYSKFLLNPMQPELWQFITYQFMHQNISHILFNMLFLYVFGNNLNEKLGHLGYTAFYLAGGVLAGCGHMLTSASPTLGASGSISAVTGMFLVLLPRTHVRLFVCLFYFYIDVWEIPSMFFILFKFGEDVFEQFAGGLHGVAYMAHISGTVAGVVVGFVLLLTGMVQRDHYDLLAMANRYRRRKAYEAVVAQGYDPFHAARSGPVAVAGKGAAVPQPADARIDSLRNEIGRLIKAHGLQDATQRYLELRTIDPGQVLVAQDQLDVANQLMADSRYMEAATAYEDYLRVYPAANQFEQIMLILGVIYARYYPRPERARELFTKALPRLHDLRQRAMAEDELARLGPGTPPAPA